VGTVPTEISMMRPIPFWPSLEAVREADAGAGEQEQSANPEGRRLGAYGACRGRDF